MLTISDCLEERSVVKMKKEYGNEPVFVAIVNLIIKKMEFFNAKHHMTDVQIGFFAHSFIEEFGHESVADLALCLTNAAMGKFGEIYNSIDPPILFKWFRLHLDTKYQEKEKQVHRKKITMLKQEEESPINQALNVEMARKIRMELKEKREEKRK